MECHICIDHICTDVTSIEDCMNVTASLKVITKLTISTRNIKELH